MSLIAQTNYSNNTEDSLTEQSKQPTKKIEQGFYMNKGRTKVDSITCYGYHGFTFIHQVSREMLAYDKIKYDFAYGSESHYIESAAAYSIEGKIYRSLVGGEAFVSIHLLIPENKMKYTKYKESLKESYYIIRMVGYVITGYEEKWDSGRQSYIKKPIYKTTQIFKEQIPLKNRELVKGRIADKIPIIGGLISLMRKSPPVPEQSEDCYPFKGEAPEIVELDVSKY